jgi:hypothetical protein
VIISGCASFHVIEDSPLAD